MAQLTLVTRRDVVGRCSVERLLSHGSILQGVESVFSALGVHYVTSASGCAFYLQGNAIQRLLPAVTS